MCLSVTLLIVDLWQYCVCCTRSGVTRCTLSTVLHLCRRCQCGLHAVPGRTSVHLIMRLLAAEPRSTTGPSFPSQCLCGTILLPMYSMVWDWRISRSVPMLYYWPKLLDPHCFKLSLLSVYRLVLWG